VKEQLTEEEYKALFAEPNHDGNVPEEADTRAGRALAHALDIRKFEIELYWKRATYFWAFIAAAFAGYALTFKSSAGHDPWLSLLFTALGLSFSFGWYLANRGSKFWQSNWERHVDLLQEISLGPLYRIIATNSSETNPLIAAGQFSVTKINQILSVFVTVIWLLLFLRELLPISPDRPIDLYKLAIAAITLLCVVLLYRLGRSRTGHAKSRLDVRTYEIKT